MTNQTNKTTTQDTPPTVEYVKKTKPSKIIEGLKMIGLFAGLSAGIVTGIVLYDGASMYFAQKELVYNKVIDTEECAGMYTASKVIPLKVIKHRWTNMFMEGASHNDNHNWFTIKGGLAGMYDAIDFCAGE